MSVNLFVPRTFGNNDTVIKVIPDPFLSTLGDGWGILIGSTILAIIVVGVCLNSMVLWTLIKLTGSKRHHSNTDYYIMALATSDLLVLISCYPLSFVSTVSRQWLFGELGCAINGFFGFLFSVIDIGVLTMMSVLRLLCVKMPHCAFIRTPRYTLISLVCVVAYALVWTILPLFGWGHFAPEPFGTSCTVDWKNPDRRYVTSIFLCVLALPLLVMVVCYSTIIYHMRVTSAKMGSFLTERKSRTQRQNRLVRMAVLMCVCFMVIWAPYAVLSICFSYIPKFDVTAIQSAIPTVLAKFSHVANPLMCFTLNQSYRRRLKFWCLNKLNSKWPVIQTSRSCINSSDRHVREHTQQARPNLVNPYISPGPSLCSSVNPGFFVMPLDVVSKAQSATSIFSHLRKDKFENNRKKDSSKAGENTDSIFYASDPLNDLEINNETNFTEISNDDKSVCSNSVGSSCEITQEKTCHLSDKETYKNEVMCVIQNETINSILLSQFEVKNNTPKVGLNCDCLGKESELKRSKPSHSSLPRRRNPLLL